MIAQIGARRAHRVHVRAAAALRRAHEALVDLLPHQPLARLIEELDVEPVRQPASLGAVQRIVRHQPALAEAKAPRLIEIFGDDRSARQTRRVVLDHDRRRAFGSDHQELPTPVPRPFLDERRLDSHFAKDEADETGMRTKGMVIERDHWEPSEWPREPRAGDSAARRKASNAAGQVNSGLTRHPPSAMSRSGGVPPRQIRSYADLAPGVRSPHRDGPRISADWMRQTSA